MQRIMSKVIRHATEMEKLADAEARYGKEVDAALGASRMSASLPGAMKGSPPTSRTTCSLRDPMTREDAAQSPVSTV